MPTLTRVQRSRAARAPFRRALAAAGVTLVALALTFALEPLRTGSPFLLPFAAVVATSWYAGWRAGVLCAGACMATLLVAGGTRAPGEALWSPDTIVRLAAFVVVSGTAVATIGLLDRTARQLRAAEAFAETVVQSAPVLMAGADEGGRIVLFNEACERLTGRPRAEVLGKPFVETLVPSHARDAVVERFRTGDVATLATPHTNPWIGESGERLIEWRCFRLPTVGTGTYVLGIGQDVTEQRRAEDRLRQALLEQEAARHEAEAAVRTTQRFVATVAHEMRAPIDVISGRLRMLRLTNPGLDRNATTVLERNAALLEQLAADLVEFSRVSGGKVRLRPQVLDLREYLRTFATSAQLLAQEKNLTLQVELDPDLRPVWADPSRVQQILLNLVSNAIKFSPPGAGIVIRARAEGGFVALSVIDSGEGVAPADLPRLFEPFWQGRERPPHSTGLGLGLTIVRELAQLHGGSAEAAAAPMGQGLALTVRLPQGPPAVASTAG